MDQETLKKRNDLLAQISGLKASIKGLELTNNNDFVEIIEGNKKALLEVEGEFKKFELEVEDQRQKDIEEQQKRRQKEIVDDFKAINKFLVKMSKVGFDDKPSIEDINLFKSISRRPHVIRRLKLLGLK
jgi:hypothetical protein